MGTWRSVREGLEGLSGVGSSVLSTWGIREGYDYVFFGGVGNRCGVLGRFGDEGDVYLESFLCPLKVVVSPSLQCPLVLVCLGVCSRSRF